VNFTCDRCGRLYSIADEKVQGRTFRVKCRACEHTIVVRAAADTAEPPPAPALRPPPPPPSPSPPPPARPPTPAMSDAELAWLSGGDGATGGTPPAAEPAPAAPASGTAHLEEGFFTAEGGTEGRAAAPAPSAKPVPRRRAMILAAAGVLAAGVVGAAFFLVPRRPATRLTAVVVQAPVPPPPLAAEPVPAAAPPPVATPEPPAPPATAAAAPAQAALPPARAAFEPVGASGAPVHDRRKQLRIATKDRKLLDLLERKQDVSVAAPVERESLDTAGASLDAPAVERTVAENRRAFAACIEKAVHANPNLHVSDLRATLIATVQPGGTVSSAWIAEEAMDKSDLGRCLVRAARRMVFPAFGGEPIDVAVPLALSAVH